MQRKKFFDFQLGLMALPLLVLAACGGGDDAPPVAAAPKVERIEPASAVVGQAKEFSVTGRNLPLTAVLSLQDGACQTPSARTSSGFKAVCTPGGPAGTKRVTVHTDTEASGGKVIDSTHSVDVAGILTDTGITASQCHATGSDAWVSCTSAAAIALNSQQDGMTGRDVTNPDNSDGKLGFSYSTVGSYTKQECVKDNITGLTWEGKPTSGTRAASNTYTNYDDPTAAQFWNGSAYVNPTQAQIDATTNTVGYVNAVNAAKLCGYSDWRLPTKDELQGIVDYSVAYPGPTIDGTWFPNTQQYAYWTGTGRAGASSVAWVVDFGNGNVYDYYRDYDYRVRLVR